MQCWSMPESEIHKNVFPCDEKHAIINRLYMVWSVFYCLTVWFTGDISMISFAEYGDAGGAYGIKKLERASESGCAHG
jgi:hypothetical protein